MREKPGELEEARELQFSMLPKELPRFPHLEIAAYLKPATEVGGDYYDFVKSDDGALTIIIGDATGHGLKAGTMVAATKSLFNSLGRKEDMLEILNEMNRSLYNMKLHNLAMCALVLRIKDNDLVIASAGMPPALLYSCETGEVTEIILKGMSLGSAKEFPYKKATFKVHSGDLLFLMSDGFPERFNPAEEMIDYSAGKRILRESGNLSPIEAIDRFVNYGDKWGGDRPQDDDVTFLAIKII